MERQDEASLQDEDGRGNRDLGSEIAIVDMKLSSMLVRLYSGSMNACVWIPQDMNPAQCISKQAPGARGVGFRRVLRPSNRPTSPYTLFCAASLLYTQLRDTAG